MKSWKTTMKSSKSFFLIALSCLKPNRKVMFQNVAYGPTVYENGCQSLIFLHYKSRMTNTFQGKYLQTMGLKDFSVFFFTFFDGWFSPFAFYKHKDGFKFESFYVHDYINVCWVSEILSMIFKMNYHNCTI